MIAYVRGLRRDISVPYTTTIRARQRYILPERKAGPMVNGIKYLSIRSASQFIGRQWDESKHQYSHQKVVKIKWVVMQHYSAGISNNF